MGTPPSAFGWLRDLPDHRDCHPGQPEVAALLASLPAADPQISHWQVDLREDCPPVQDQGILNSSSAHACIGLLEYFECRATRTVNRYSRLFLYKTSRRLLGLAGDAGASLRATLKAIARF